MMPTSLPTMAFNSPQRKRASSDADCDSPPASPPSTASVSSLQETRLREEEDLGEHSPRAAVAGRLRALAIHGDHFSNPHTSNGNIDQEHSAESLQARCWLSSCNGLHDVPETTPSIQNDPHSNGLSEIAGNSQTEYDNTPTSPTSPTRTKKRSPSSSPRKKRTPPITSKMRKKQTSPPLTESAIENPLTWHDSEITGHNPTDPNDDGYGINGIGFKPTAAIAWARSQKRQKQVADWKTREAREARERRRERRDGMELDKIRTIQSGAIQKKVKFAF